MIKQDLRDKIRDNGFERFIVYDYPSFDDSIIGVEVNGTIVYAYPLMVEEYIMDECDNNTEPLTNDELYEKRTDAMEFIDYNTLRATPYMGPTAPVVLDFNPESEDYYNMVSGEKYDINKIEFKIEDKYNEFKNYY